jgi:hypothetical protein
MSATLFSSYCTRGAYAWRACPCRRPDAEGSRRARYEWVKNALECSEREGVDLPIYMNQAHSHDATNSS